MSSEIFETGGIPDILDMGPNIVSDEDELNNDLKNLKLNYQKISNNSVLSRILTNTFRVLLTRNLNVQLPIKFHLLDNISDVSSVQIEKYRTYLPYYINYLENLIVKLGFNTEILREQPQIVKDNGGGLLIWQYFLEQKTTLIKVLILKII
jgi:hypothetical protein